ncbi:hypothetical protein QYE76_056710 [Lolium multiflorum]|uniref:Uncharacterized protein n=1 Tax=Lolium multiflorum TaxID=4521 RepID=A0AAD8T256_LOLMU|nr:hypothetical protein QYE76_056710 [Lolium multiflorum]
MRATNLLPTKPINIHASTLNLSFAPLTSAAAPPRGSFSAVLKMPQEYPQRSRRDCFARTIHRVLNLSEPPREILFAATPTTAESITMSCDSASTSGNHGNLSSASSLRSGQADPAQGLRNHVTLCEGHLRVTPELPLFQYYFSVKKEKIRQTSELATCGSITFMLRPGRVYPHTDRHESARYWSGGFFYLKDVSDPASKRTLPPFKNSPASETPAWTQCPYIFRALVAFRAD